MAQLMAGFSRVNITPMLGIEMYGYYSTREADGILDELEINAIALACGDQKALMFSADQCGMVQGIIAQFRSEISAATGVPEGAIFIHATHAHTGPYLVDWAQSDPNVLSNIIDTNPSDAQKKLQTEYYQFFRHRIVDAAVLALNDLKPARMSWGTSVAPKVAFVRRYRMKDGSTATNPGRLNPNIQESLGQADEQVCILRFEREGGSNILLSSFGNHPDVIGGTKLSADWPGHTRRIVEQIVPDTNCIFFNGTMGDVNHIDVSVAKEKSLQGYALSKHIGQVVAGGVLQALGKLQYAEVTDLRAATRKISVPANKARPEELGEAHRIHALHLAGKDDELPGEGMAKAAIIAGAARMVRLESAPDAFHMDLSAVALGGIVLLGIPGQLFAHSGFELKAIPGWEMVVPTSQTNGSEGYYPHLTAYKEGGYESATSNFKAGSAEMIVQEATKFLNDLKSGCV